MAKALTTETRAAKVAAQEKVVARLKARRDKAAKTLAEVEAPLRFEQARLVHLQNTPVVDEVVGQVADESTATETETVEAVDTSNEVELTFA